MTIFLAICLLILGALYFHTSYSFRKMAKQSNGRFSTLLNEMDRLVEANQEWERNYNALEQGMDEQQDNFDQQLASFIEIVTERNELLVNKANRETYISQLEDEVERHRRDCLPNLGHMDSIDV